MPDLTPEKLAELVQRLRGFSQAEIELIRAEAERLEVESARAAAPKGGKHE